MIGLEIIILLMDALLMGAAVSAVFRFMVFQTRDYLKEKGQISRLYYMIVFAAGLSVLPIIVWLGYSIVLVVRSIYSMHAVGGWFAARIAICVSCLLIAVWIVGVIYEIGWLIKMHRRFEHRIFAANTVVTDRKLLNMLEDFSIQANLSNIPLLFCNASVKSPFVKGILNPVIVLPDRKLSEKELLIIIAHEVEHCRRRDVLVRWSVKISQVLFWFVPGNRLWMEELIELQETLCDQSVCSRYRDSVGSATAYYETILIISSIEDQMNPFFCSGIAERKSQTRRRVENMYALQTSKGIGRICASCLLLAISAVGILLNPTISLAYNQYSLNQAEIYQAEEERFMSDRDENADGFDLAQDAEGLDVWGTYTSVTLLPGESAVSSVSTKEQDWFFQGVAVADVSDYEILLVNGEEAFRFTPDCEICTFCEPAKAGTYYMKIVNLSNETMNLEVFVQE